MVKWPAPRDLDHLKIFAQAQASDSDTQQRRVIKIPKHSSTTWQRYSVLSDIGEVAKATTRVQIHHEGDPEVANAWTQDSKYETFDYDEQPLRCKSVNI